MKTRLSLLIALFALCLVSCNSVKPFTFVQMCDPQLGFGGYAKDSLALAEAVSKINSLHPDFVVVCGDLVHIPGEKSYSDFKTIISGLEMPYYLAPGNHDMGSYSRDPKPDSIDYYRSVIGKDYYSFTYHNYSFVVVNTTLWADPVPGETEKEDSWLKQTLSDLDPRDSLIVIAHHQLFNDNPQEQDPGAPIDAGKRDELLAMFKSAGLAAYLHGHTHMTSEKEFDGVKYVSGEATSVNLDKRPFGFRIWEVTDTSLTEEFVPIE
jgi:serine/threonine-protein phosphatase CPPED1